MPLVTAAARAAKPPGSTWIGPACFRRCVRRALRGVLAQAAIGPRRSGRTGPARCWADSARRGEVRTIAPARWLAWASIAACPKSGHGALGEQCARSVRTGVCAHERNVGVFVCVEIARARACVRACVRACIWACLPRASAGAAPRRTHGPTKKRARARTYARARVHTDTRPPACTPSCTHARTPAQRAAQGYEPTRRHPPPPYTHEHARVRSRIPPPPPPPSSSIVPCLCPLPPAYASSAVIARGQHRQGRRARPSRPLSFARSRPLPLPTVPGPGPSSGPHRLPGPSPRTPRTPRARDSPGSRNGRPEPCLSNTAVPSQEYTADTAVTSQECIRPAARPRHPVIDFHQMCPIDFLAMINQAPLMEIN
jgi:hypothetical protein